MSLGGQTAGYIDLAERIGDKLPSMILIVVGLSFVVLLIAFRSLLLPLKAAVCQPAVGGRGLRRGHVRVPGGPRGRRCSASTAPIPIVSFAPLLMFAILFGLSMDYEVFLLTQIQEHWKEDGKPTKAVIDGLASTGRVITSAALIMVCVFTSFILNGDPTVKQFGVGLSRGDRDRRDAGPVPAGARDHGAARAGRRGSCRPGSAALLPRVSIEGEDYFAAPRPRHGRARRRAARGAARRTTCSHWQRARPPAIAALARDGGRLAIDTEFVSERRYQAQLCLVQAAVPDDGDGGVRTEVLDPLDQSDQLDPGPLAEALADPDVEVVVHAGRQDVAILRRTW